MAGNKGNIYVKQGNGTGVYLYTQREGLRLPKIVQSALARGRERWGDTSSLTRILFGELVQKDALGNIGFGISTHLNDNENFIIVIDDKAERIGFFCENGQLVKVYTFAQYANLDEVTLDWARVCGGNRFENQEHSNNPRRGDPYVGM